ncbi:MAG: hypothetical protein FJX35_27775 [Alphaproteobacteria bacterium]|nr:hypothetical protein [Alphaproteobacteria bacterium]
MVNNLWPMLKEAVSSYIEHDALSRGAAIAFYAATALAPVLLILMAIVGLVLGEQAAREALTYQPAFPRWPHQFVTKAANYDIRFNTLQVIGVTGHGAGDG